MKLTFGVVRGKEGEEGEERERRGRKGRRETMCIETRMRKRSMKVKRWRVERSEYSTHKHNPHTMYLPSVVKCCGLPSLTSGTSLKGHT